MLDLITIFSAAGLPQELKVAHGDKSLVIREDSQSASPSFVESAAEFCSAALDAVDGAMASSLDVIMGGSTAADTDREPAKKV
eukprot:Skav212756  [mRNA]  locus=scaffold2545:207973:210621:- [translate_table: standard]